MKKTNDIKKKTLDKPKIVIHVGLGKSGSTFLQKAIFPRLKGVEVYGANNQRLQIYSQFKEDKINILTDENFLGCALKFKNLNATKSVLINRLSSMFPDAKIIIVLRDKDDWLWSLYKKYIRTGGIKKYDSFCVDMLNPHFINFEETVAILKKNFKEVLVLQYDDLKNNHSNFVKDICDFIGVDVPMYKNEYYNKDILDKDIGKYIFFNKLFKTEYNAKGVLPFYWNPVFRWHYLLGKYGNG